MTVRTGSCHKTACGFAPNSKVEKMKTRPHSFDEQFQQACSVVAFSSYVKVTQTFLCNFAVPPRTGRVD